MTRFALLLSLLIPMVWATPIHAQEAESQPLTCPIEPYITPVPDESLAAHWGLADDALPSIPPIQQVLIPDDGSVFVVIAKEESDFTPTIYRYAPQAGELSVLLDAPILDALRTEEYAGGVILGTPTFIPNTHTLLFYTEIVPNTDGIYFEIPSDLWLLDIDTGTLVNLLPFGEGGNFSLSPAGTQLVLATQNTLRVGNPDGTDLKVIYEGIVGVPGGEFIDWPDILWTGEDTFRAKLLNAADGADPNAGFDPRISTQIVEFDLSQDPVTPEVLLSVSGTMYWGTHISPNAEALAYWMPSEGAGRELFIQPIGSQPILFASGDSTDILQWVSDQHVEWYDIAMGMNYITDLCGDTVPAS